MRSQAVSGITSIPTRHLQVAREAAGTYVPKSRLGDAVVTVVAAVDRLADVDPGGCDEPAIRGAMVHIQTQVRRLHAVQTALAAQLTARQAHRLDPADPGSRKVRLQAERDTQHELADTLHLTHAEAKDAVAAGTALQGLSEASRAAFGQGRISQRHARKLAETLDALDGLVDRHQLEHELLDAAKKLDAVGFGRHCRKLIAHTDARQAQRDLDRLRNRRYGSVTTDPDGMLHIRAGFVGAEAEVVATAIETFRGKDQPGDLRTPSQRTADAIFDACNHALRHADSTDHGNRPHGAPVRWPVRSAAR